MVVADPQGSKQNPGYNLVTKFYGTHRYPASDHERQGGTNPCDPWRQSEVGRNESTVAILVACQKCGELLQAVRGQRPLKAMYPGECKCTYREQTGGKKLVIPIRPVSSSVNRRTERMIA